MRRRWASTSSLSRDTSCTRPKVQCTRARARRSVCIDRRRAAGIGATYVRSADVPLGKFMHGAKHEAGRRAGTGTALAARCVRTLAPCGFRGRERGAHGRAGRGVRLSSAVRSRAPRKACVRVRDGAPPRSSAGDIEAHTRRLRDRLESALARGVEERWWARALGVCRHHARMHVAQRPACGARYARQWTSTRTVCCFCCCVSMAGTALTSPRRLPNTLSVSFRGVNVAKSVSVLLFGPTCMLAFSVCFASTVCHSTVLINLFRLLSCGARSVLDVPHVCAGLCRTCSHLWRAALARELPVRLRGCSLP